MNKTELYYGGCIRETGHYLFESEQQKRHYAIEGMVDRLREGAWDGTFLPPYPSHYGEYQKSMVGDWLIVSWHDCSVDKRPGSNSTFLGRGFKDHASMMAEAKLKFPSVFRRQLCPLVERRNSDDIEK